MVRTFDIDKEELDGVSYLTFALRSLYARRGYRRFRMSKFEEYDLYADNKDFLVSGDIITFTDMNGKLMALKPDVTLSIIKNLRGSGERLSKVYYDENVYRIPQGGRAFTEIRQAGLECIGDVDDGVIREALGLAMESLDLVSDESVLDVSDLDIVSGVIGRLGLSPSDEKEAIKCVSRKNAPGIKAICEKAGADAELTELACGLATAYGSSEDVRGFLSRCGCPEEAKRLLDAVEWLENAGYNGRVRVDFSVINDMNYYNGFVFRGFVPGVPDGVLAGGQYDNLLRKMGGRGSSIGFAVYVDALAPFAEDDAKTETDGVLNVALPKGRLGERVYDMFSRAGFASADNGTDGRKLTFMSVDGRVRYFWVKPSDVAIYVERGAADVGVCGADILIESEPDVYELLDLKTGVCRMMVAGKTDFTDDGEGTLRVATKFTKAAKDYYDSLGRDIDIIKLNGSIELAPILGLSDVIVDIVETGTTLKENGLEPKEKIFDISARLIANKTSFKFKGAAIEDVNAGLAGQVEK